MTPQTTHLKAPGPGLEAPPRRGTILLVDHNDDTRLLTKWFLTSFGYVVDTVRTAEGALAVFDPAIHDLVVTDNCMPGMSGVEMATVLKLRFEDTPVVMYTEKIPDGQSCIDVIIRRPTHLLKLKDAVQTLLERPT